MTCFDMKVLIAVDGSDCADKAFDWYFKQLHKTENQVIVYSHVNQPDLATHVFSGAKILLSQRFDEMRHDHEQKCLKLQQKFEEKCRKKAVHWKVIVETGHSLLAGHNVVCKADQEQVDIIVTGSAALSKYRFTRLGSVSNHILQHARVPVIVCPF